MAKKLNIVLVSANGTWTKRFIVAETALAEVNSLRYEGRTYGYAGFSGIGYRTVNFREVGNTVDIESLEGFTGEDLTGTLTDISNV